MTTKAGLLSKTFTNFLKNSNIGSGKSIPVSHIGHLMAFAANSMFLAPNDGPHEHRASVVRHASGRK